MRVLSQFRGHCNRSWVIAREGQTGRGNLSVPELSPSCLGVCRDCMIKRRGS